MFEQIAFYVGHSLNDLCVNGRRTFFALLCIAAGVAAIVSLQTLATMIDATLRGNLQANNRGDIQLQVVTAGPPEPGSRLYARMQRAVNDGFLNQEVANFFGQDLFTEYRVSARGLAEIRRWLDTQYPGEVQITYRQALGNMLSLVLGAGNGATVTAPATGNQATHLTPILIDAQVYPFYSAVTSLDGVPLAALFKSPSDIVLSENLADTLDVKVGDVVHVTGASVDFTLRGVVPVEAEVKTIGLDALNAIFGFYYLDSRAVQYFNNLETQANVLYLQLKDPARVEEIDRAILRQFPYFDSTTTEDLEQVYAELASNLNQLVTVMGLLSLLIGSIGIVNTMQVIVRRRTLEVAVLKTIGLQARQVTVLFLVEAFIMGVVGSLAGIVLGWGTVFVLKSAAEVFVAQQLAFQVAPGPALNGLVVGTLVTTVFGFLPTLSAGQVRPAIVLRPSDAIVPKAGCLGTLAALVLMMGALILIVRGLVDSWQTAIAIIVGAFVAAGVFYVLLTILIWLVGRFFPSFGVVDLTVALRQMRVGRRRNATTLLALVVGVFSLSVITLFTDTITNMLDYALNEGFGGNAVVTTINPMMIPRLEETLGAMEGVRSYQVTRSYGVRLVSLERAGTGETLTANDVRGLMREGIAQGGLMYGEAADRPRLVDQMMRSALGNLGGIDLENLPRTNVVAGRGLTRDDAGAPALVVTESDAVRWIGINVGDRLTFEFTGGGSIFGSSTGGEQEGSGAGVTITFEVVGIAEGGGMVNMGAAPYKRP
ncbi:MAG: ABC transporter permease [Anaerolineae bacterium]|nr:ABC transporter permease [Anaerolineae bacterium]